MQKKDDLLTPPFYKRPGYWLVVAGLAAAWWHREKIKSWFDRGSLRGLSGMTEFDSAMNDANEAFREAQKSLMDGRERDGMEMARLADSYVSDAKREAGTDAFRKSIAAGLEAQVKDLQKNLAAGLRLTRDGQWRTKPRSVPSDLQTMSYGGKSISSRRDPK
jgi:hypothetical protein